MIKPDTKQIFADALVELCKTKPLEKITVQNIVDYCEAGRQTFYNHFKDKEDLVAYVFILDEKRCRERLEKNCSIEEKLGVILNTFVEKKQFYVSAYISSGQNSLGDAIFEYYFDFYTKQITEKFGRESIDKKLENAIRFHCYGSIGFVKQWMKSGMKLSVEELTSVIIDNIPEWLKKYLQ